MEILRVEELCKVYGKGVSQVKAWIMCPSRFRRENLWL